MTGTRKYHKVKITNQIIGVCKSDYYYMKFKNPISCVGIASIVCARTYVHLHEFV